MEKIFEDCGYRKANDLGEAAVILVNTCSVRQAAEDKVYGLANKIRDVRKENKDLRVILTGCLPGSALGARKRIGIRTLRQRMPWVDYFISPQNIFKRLPEILLSDEDSCERVKSVLSSPRSVIVEDESEGKKAYVPVMRGCDHFCSYCAVPFGRGAEVSRPLEDIISNVEDLVERGVTKITLLGQNINSYGKNFGDWKNNIHPFAELLRRLNSIKGLEEIWFITPNPWDFTDDLIGALTLDKVRKYLHLPLQSGDDEILKKMNRPYTREDYLNLVARIKERVPGIKLGTDLIVGFPGETRAQFQNTVDAVQQVGFDGAYIALYSPRPGTAAAELYEDTVSREEKKRRHAVLTRAVEKSTSH